MLECKNRSGDIISAYDAQGGAVRFLYGSAVGRILLKPLTSPALSRAAGRFLDSRASKPLIKSFVKKNNIDLDDYISSSYSSYNDFFCRKIKPDKRRFDTDEDALCSPCDGKLTVCKISQTDRFYIKGGEYTLQSLLQDEGLAEKYADGTLLIIRLSVDDYHRYAYPVSGRKSENVRIVGRYHTVNPYAAEMRRIYKENTREYTTVSTERFGEVLMMEVGAMMVGRIVNLHGEKNVSRGEEKGYFEFGGSTVILLLEKDTAEIDGDLIANSDGGYETAVKMGERIGTAVMSGDAMSRGLSADDAGFASIH